MAWPLGSSVLISANSSFSRIDDRAGHARHCIMNVLIVSEKTSPSLSGLMQRKTWRSPGHGSISPLRREPRHLSEPDFLL